MFPQDDIPQDVWGAARASATVPEIDLGSERERRAGIAMVIARAVMAERRRCAKAACDPERTYGASGERPLIAYMAGRSDAAADILREKQE